MGVVHETLKSTVSSEWTYELTDFLNVDSDVIIYG